MRRPAKSTPKICLVVALAVLTPAARPLAFAKNGEAADLESTAYPARRTVGERACPANVANTVESSVELARQAMRRFDYKGALDLLDHASRNSKDSPILLAAYGSVYLKAEEAGRARQYLDRAVKLDPACPEALLGQAEASVLERNYPAAEGWLNQVLSTYLGANTASSNAHALLARVQMENGNRVLAAAEAEKAIEADNQNALGFYMMAFVKAVEQRPALVRSFASRALRLDSNLSGARRLLSQYVNGSVGYQQKVDLVALRHFEKGKSLEEGGHPTEALIEFETAVTAEPRYYRALIAIAGIRLSERDYRQAAPAASRALEVDPDGAIANLQLACAHAGMAEQARTEIGATDYRARFYDQSEPLEKTSLLRLVFPDYERLTDQGRFVLRRSVAGLACFLPSLVSAGARHYLLRLDQGISEVAGFSDIRNRTTFDGRYYASIRGIGGRIALSGVEYLDEASRGGLNAIAHEFAHQVQETVMGPEDLRLIHTLYEAAKREGRGLDFYAAANEFEYFAAGYEAFESSFKRPGAGLTARHTRDELASRDPALYSLLAKFAARSAQVGKD